MLAISLALVLAIVGVAGCASEEPPVSHGGLVKDYISLIDNLRQAGATVEPAGELTQPFFSVNGAVITVNGSDVQVFEYADAADAEAEAALVSPDGSSIGTSNVRWIASPHFYRAEKLIVLYIGDSEAITDLLESVLGQQFAGGAYISIDGKDLEDITWLLESYGAAESLQTVLAGTEITAIFDSAEGIVHGSAGCNGYSGEYMLSNNNISIPEMTWTEMGCPEPAGILEQETQYLKALQSAESYEISVGKLQITSAGQVLIFRGSEE